MKTIICDIDGTLTDMWPLERLVLKLLLNNLKVIDKLHKDGVVDTFRIYKAVSKNKIKKIEYYDKYNRAFSKLFKNKNLPIFKAYPLVGWILKNKTKYNFIYATGGQKQETEYVLEKLGLIRFFDLKNSINKTNCRFSKKSGIPFRILKRKYGNPLLLTDTDCAGAKKAGVEFINMTKLKNQKIYGFSLFTSLGR